MRVSFSILCLATLPFQTTAESNIVEQFQSFTTNPTPIAELVFEQDMPNTAKTWGLVRWQTNAYLIRRSTSPDVLAKPYDKHKDIELTGRFENHYWVIKEDVTVGTKLMSWTHSGNQAEASNAVARIHAASQLSVQHVFNLGIPLVGVSQVQWNGTSFKGVDGNSSTVTGQMTIGPYGRPLELNLLVSHARKLGNHPIQIPGKVAYEYGESALPSWCPGLITRQITNPATLQPETVNKLTIHKLKFGFTAEEEFLPGRFLSNSAVAILTITNGKTFYGIGTSSGELLSANDPRARQVASAPTSPRRFLVLAAMILLLIAAVVAIYVAHKRNAGNKSNPDS